LQGSHNSFPQMSTTARYQNSHGLFVVFSVLSSGIYFLSCDLKSQVIHTEVLFYNAQYFCYFIFLIKSI